MVVKRAKRPGEAEARKRALAAARMAMKDHISLSEAARQCSTSRDSVNQAWLILRHGTEEEIANVEGDLIGMVSVAETIRARVPRDQRERQRAKKNREQLHAISLDAAIWAKLREALDAISSLPRPVDVVAIVRKNQTREKTLNTKLIAAHGWITEFSDAWTK